jgi:hypothetical protein
MAFSYFTKGRADFQQEPRLGIISLSTTFTHTLASQNGSQALSQAHQGWVLPFSYATALHKFPELLVRADTSPDGWFREINSQWPGMFSQRNSALLCCVDPLTVCRAGHDHQVRSLEIACVEVSGELTSTGSRRSCTPSSPSSR